MWLRRTAVPQIVMSEGKIIEIVPVIETPYGDSMMLPPVCYQVPNWQLGFEDEHPIGIPSVYYMKERMYVQGSNSNLTYGIRFLVRIMEHSEDSMPYASKVIDMKAVRSLLDGLKVYDAYRATQTGNAISTRAVSSWTKGKKEPRDRSRVARLYRMGRRRS